LRECGNIRIAGLEAEAWRRAVEGVAEPLVSMGKLVRDENDQPIAIRKYSDALMAVLLRAHKPEKYAERKQVEFDVSDRLADRLEAARQRARYRSRMLASQAALH
jgi:hypothetical protein